MGWNDLSIHVPKHPLLAGICRARTLTSSIHMASARVDASVVLASVDYGGEVVAVIGRDNLVGTQFHPEKSQTTGLRLIGNFLEVAAVIFFPAIDLKDGTLRPPAAGDMATATVFNAGSGGPGAAASPAPAAAGCTSSISTAPSPASR